MSRDNFDIPEVFRRAMEDAGWDDSGDGGDEGNERRPFQPRPGRPRQPNRLVWLIGLVVLLLFSLNWIVTTYTEWLWFTELNYAGVWLKQWSVRLLSFAVAFVIALVVLLVNWYVARQRAIRSAPPFNPRIVQMRVVRWVINGAALFLAFGFAGVIGGRWHELLRYVYRVPYGTADPIFNQDVTFYLLELPVYRLVQEWALSLLVVALLGVIAIYALNHIVDIQRGQWRPHEAPALRRHVALVGALILGLWAVGYWFDVYGLLSSPVGVVYGATYTDMNASIWALWAQLVLMALTALALAYNVFRLDFRPVLVTGGLWLAATLLLAGLYPGLLQRYSVEPNEIERERPYIEHNIQFTRLAFGLDQVETRPFDTVTDLAIEDLEANEVVLQNVRLWDYRPLQQTYQQLQALRLYYQFSEIDVDRYEIDGQLRQVMLAGRELNKSELPFSSWVNLNLEFTHGYGIVMNPVDQVTADGQPVFFIQDLPPQSTVPIEVTRPEIYYGEMTTDTVFVGSGREEFNYPSGDENVYTSYEGEGGVPMDNYLKRLAFAFRLSDANVLLSNEITADTRVQYHRQIQERVLQITPYLQLDGDPYLVVWDGRLVWLQDAYTVSNDFPYATPFVAPNGFRFNYIRNAAKITIDAYDGAVTYYLAAPEDPLIQSYARAFPGLFRPLAEIPEGLQAHIRYPEDLFQVQAQQHLTYHMTDARVFYNKEDLWQIPMELVEGVEQPMEPYYVILSLPGESASEYLLIQPFTPNERPNMVAWMAARNDVPHYGELVVYELPKQELIFGPMQIEGRINQDTEISQQFSLWDQGGSNVIRGNLIVIPLGESFLYIEPVYLLSTANALPELKRVVVASGTRIAMRETLDEALTALLRDEPAVDIFVTEDDTPVEDILEAAAPGTAEPTPPAAGEDVAEAPLDATADELIRSANAHFEAAQAAQRDGDWTTYGRELEALQQDLEQLIELTNETP